jgi:hypothetical protein
VHTHLQFNGKRKSLGLLVPVLLQKFVADYAETNPVVEDLGEKLGARGAQRGPVRTPAHLRPSGIRRRARSAAPSAQLGSRQSSVNTQNNDKVRTSSFNENQ